MKVAVLTAVYDSYDTLKDIKPQTVEHEAICITDSPVSSATWDVRHEPRPGIHPNRAAKRPKCCPWEYTDADVTIWLDASFQVVSPDFVEAMLDYLPLGQFAHWERDCLYDEAIVSMGMGKYAGEPLADQASTYQERGVPSRWGLWATGLIVRQRTKEIVAFGEQWAHEIDLWTFQDQVSEPAVLHDYDLRPTAIPGAYHQNPWLLYAGSSRH